jgi:glycerol kinase
MQKLADLLKLEVRRPKLIETAALGAAYVAGLQAGIFDSLQSISEKWQLDQSFEATKDDAWREKQYSGWLDAVSRTRTNIEGID